LSCYFQPELTLDDRPSRELSRAADVDLLDCVRWTSRACVARAFLPALGWRIENGASQLYLERFAAITLKKSVFLNEVAGVPTEFFPTFISAIIEIVPPLCNDRALSSVG
jgi:hypothetical protein